MKFIIKVLIGSPIRNLIINFLSVEHQFYRKVRFVVLASGVRI